jgi:hypothetical protein
MSVVQSNATGHQLTACLECPLFSISPYQQTENDFLSTHFTLWGTDAIGA